MSSGGNPTGQGRSSEGFKGEDRFHPWFSNSQPRGLPGMWDSGMLFLQPCQTRHRAPAAIALKFHHHHPHPASGRSWPGTCTQELWLLAEVSGYLLMESHTH